MSGITNETILDLARASRVKGESKALLDFGRRLLHAASVDSHKWRPIETAPKDNKQPLFLAEISSTGELLDLEYGAFWAFTWFGNSGIRNPTHWSYMGDAMLPPYHTPASKKPINKSDVVYAVAMVLGGALSATLFGLWIGIK